MSPFPLSYALALPNLYCLVSLLLYRRFARKCIQNHFPRMQNVHLRLTCVGQKRLCLYSLLTFPHATYVKIQESSIFKNTEHQKFFMKVPLKLLHLKCFGAYACFVVQVLFEMKNQGITPNAVTYGYYNRVSTLLLL